MTESKQITSYADQCKRASTDTLKVFLEITIAWGDIARTFIIANELEKRGVMF